MARRQPILSLLASITGVLLAPVAYLATLSGFCIRSPSLVEKATLQLLDYGFCSYLHLDLLPLLLAILGSLHAIASTETLYAKLAGSRLGHITATVYRLLVYLFAAQTIVLVVVVRLLA